MTSRNPKFHYFVDCYGRSFTQEISVETSRGRWTFIYDEERKKGKQFCLTLILDRGLLTPRNLYRYPFDRRVLLLVESPNEPQFRLKDQYSRLAPLVLTHLEELLVQGRPFERVDYGVSWINDGNPIEDSHKIKLVSFMGSLLHPDTAEYHLRKQVAHCMLDRFPEDCFGKGIREVPSKLAALQDYCFSVAMENAQVNWYYTEKLIDCLLAKTVPIYFGCEDIGNVFDTRGFIRFNSLEDLQGILQDLSMAKYRAMLPFVEENCKRAVERRLTSYQGLYTNVALHLDNHFDNPTTISQLFTQRPFELYRRILYRFTGRN